MFFLMYIVPAWHSALVYEWLMQDTKKNNEITVSVVCLEPGASGGMNSSRLYF